MGFVLGNVVGIELGFNEGEYEGKDVGAFEGDAEGLEVFANDGGVDEFTVGIFDGVLVGLGVTLFVGSRVRVTEGEEVNVSLTAFLATIFFLKSWWHFPIIIICTTKQYLYK